jgi:uncharacterized damage-inducible protein DinB
MNAIDVVVQHNSWATAQLIEYFRSMPPATLDLSAPGTFGTIGATLAHIVGAERAYLARLKGETPTAGQGTQDLAQLAGEAKSLSEEFERLLQAGINPDLEVQTKLGPQTAGILLAQIVNHATEHRAHVCTVLGAHGMQPPALDAFAYRAALGPSSAI